MKINEKKLITAMFDAGLNIGQLAEKAGATRATVSAVRNGKSCSMNTVFKIATALNVEPYELLED